MSPCVPLLDSLNIVEVNKLYLNYLLVSFVTYPWAVWQNNRPKKLKVSSAFFFFFMYCCSCFFSAVMEVTARFIALDRQYLPFIEYSWEICRLAAVKGFDATILSLFWHRADSHRPVDLPDPKGLRPLSVVLLPPPSVGKSSLPPSAALPTRTEPAPFQELTESTP